MKCLYCAVETTNLKFCSNACQQAAQNEQRRQDFLDGKYMGRHLQFRSWSKSMIEDLLGSKCNSCGVGNEWNGKPLTLQVNHKDGIATNNVLPNLELLCPNCHSQTENYGSKNKGSTRSWRRKIAA